MTELRGDEVLPYAANMPNIYPQTLRSSADRIQTETQKNIRGEPYTLCGALWVVLTFLHLHLCTLRGLSSRSAVNPEFQSWPLEPLQTYMQTPS